MKLSDMSANAGLSSRVRSYAKTPHAYWHFSDYEDLNMSPVDKWKHPNVHGIYGFALDRKLNEAIKFLETGDVGHGYFRNFSDRANIFIFRATEEALADCMVMGSENGKARLTHRNKAWTTDDVLTNLNRLGMRAAKDEIMIKGKPFLTGFRVNGKLIDVRYDQDPFTMFCSVLRETMTPEEFNVTIPRILKDLGIRGFPDLGMATGQGGWPDEGVFFDLDAIEVLDKFKNPH